MSTIVDSRQFGPDKPETQYHPAPLTRVRLYLMVAAMVMIWSCNFAITKVAIKEFPILALSGIRIQTAALILLTVFWVCRGNSGFAPLRYHWRSFAKLGLFGVALNQGLFVVGLKFTSVSHSSLIIAAGPVFVLILARFYGLEKLSWQKLIGLALSLAGLHILVAEHLPGQQSGVLGDLVSVCGVLAFAFYAILSKQTASRFDSLSVNTFMFLFGAGMLLPLSVGALLDSAMVRVTWRGWLAMFYMAGFSSVLAYLIFYFALRYMSATKLTALSYLQPPIASFLGWVILDESITRHTIAGALVILVGVYTTEKR